MVRVVKDPRERRLEIIQAARKLFETKSFEKTTMKDVMMALDIAKGTIYHYFSSKEEILEAVVEFSVDEYIESIQARLKNFKGNAIERFRILILSGDMSEDHPEILDSLHSPGNVGMHTRQLAVTVLKLAPLYAQAVQQGCEEGLFETDFPLETSEFILTATQFLVDMGIHPWEGETLMRRIQAYPAMITALLKAPKGSFDFILEQFN